MAGFNSARWSCFVPLFVVGVGAAQSTALSFPIPRQDRGMPYTRSCHPLAHKQIDVAIAVFGGSRYAFLYGHKVRLDDAPDQMLHAEALFRDGKVYVPKTFASALELSAFTPPPPPPYLQYKWVDTFPRRSVAIPASVPSITVDSLPHGRPAAEIQRLRHRSPIDVAG